jgi:hypothetical protein
MPREYFFVSDLHIGGDEQLKILDFEDDFIAFLRMLEQREGLGGGLHGQRRRYLLQRLVARKPQRDALQDIPQRTVIE